MLKCQIVRTSTLCLLFVGVMVTATFAGEKTRTSSQASSLDKQTENRARQVIKIAGCNDCHTTGYAEAAGKIPEKDWLTGGFKIDNE